MDEHYFLQEDPSDVDRAVEVFMKVKRFSVHFFRHRIMLHIKAYVSYNICGLFVFSFMLFYVRVHLIAQMNFQGFVQVKFYYSLAAQ